MHLAPVDAKHRCKCVCGGHAYLSPDAFIPSLSLLFSLLTLSLLFSFPLSFFSYLSPFISLQISLAGAGTGFPGGGGRAPVGVARRRPRAGAGAHRARWRPGGGRAWGPRSRRRRTPGGSGAWRGVVERRPRKGAAQRPRAVVGAQRRGRSAGGLARGAVRQPHAAAGELSAPAAATQGQSQCWKFLEGFSGKD
ncbi:unnamed protein product [Urochloa humidicola]